ncbi:MAG TPA: T9SS type A sorting domain-containing protein, partial [Parafilimonas sp.]|nr:T9SS type A sorting domain-containing protein [Parafilimonas sp.]
EFNTLAANYAADNLCFLYAGLTYINSSFLNNNFNADTDPSSDFNSYQVPNCINVFYMQKINGNNPSCGGNCGYGGIALGGIPGTYCLIASGNIASGQTISHEVGHCMGLLHTFEPNNGYEDIDGTNSSTSADLIADTPADPYVFKSQNNSCFALSTDGCKYAGTCTDPKNQTNYSPPYSNLMSYWWSTGCYPSLAITNDQFSRINSYLLTYAPLLQCESPSSETISNVNVSSGYYFASAVGTLNSGDNVNISGTTISTLGGGNIIINPGFHATPSGSGLVLVRVDQCGDARSFSTKQSNVISSIQPEVKKENSIIVYPNPTNSIINLQLNLAHNESKISVKVYDMNMKMMKEVALENLLKGINTSRLDLSKLSSGMYVIILQSEDMISKTFVVLQK